MRRCLDHHRLPAQSSASKPWPTGPQARMSLMPSLLLQRPASGVLPKSSFKLASAPYLRQRRASGVSNIEDSALGHSYAC